jgi:hypothetical protein
MVYNAPLPLTISQAGFPNIKIAAAKYETRPFKVPYYWDLRFSRVANNRSWEFEFVHHKIYLINKPDEVQRFSISHGFNIATINRGFFFDHFHIRFGLGAVLTHPEITVRNQKLDESLGLFNDGYYIRGPSLNASIGSRFYPIKRVFVNIEGKTTYSYVNVPVNGGNASLSNLAFHLIAGIGIDYISK